MKVCRKALSNEVRLAASSMVSIMSCLMARLAHAAYRSRVARRARAMGIEGRPRGGDKMAQRHQRRVVLGKAVVRVA